jgi:hypothetical protein
MGRGSTASPAFIFSQGSSAAIQSVACNLAAKK